MTTFTASEVRRQASTFGRGRVNNMLYAFADLLEAQEKAVPVYQHRSKNGPMFRWFDCSEETFMAMEHNEHDRKHFDRRILYTHPASADAERLAEALQEILDYRGGAANALEDGLLWHRAHQALAAHSAKAQPPVAGVPIPCKCYTEQDRKYCIHKANGGECWRAGALAAHSSQAQPPAASVPNLERFVVIDRAALNRMLTTRDFSELMRAAQEDSNENQFP